MYVQHGARAGLHGAEGRDYVCTRPMGAPSTWRTRRAFSGHAALLWVVCSQLAQRQRSHIIIPVQYDTVQ